jgi:outer membrane protein OmpA-like peptidoglycan-associated protein
MSIATNGCLLWRPVVFIPGGSNRRISSREATMLFRSIPGILIALLLISTALPLRPQPVGSSQTPSDKDESMSTMLHPILPYIFFDSASAVIPERYHCFSSPDETLSFRDTANAAGILATYYDVLNVIGYRMRKYPGTKVELGVTQTRHWRLWETKEMIGRRQQVVREYLMNVWGVDSARIVMSSPVHIRARGILSQKELVEDDERRVEILSNDWEIMRPIERPTSDSAPTSYLYPLILFTFDSPEPGKLNERIMKEMVMPAITPTSTVNIVGYTDIIGLEDRNLKLSDHRARATANIIGKVARRRKASMSYRGVGEESETFGSALPEQRLYSRRVEVRISTVKGVVIEEKP